MLAVCCAALGFAQPIWAEPTKTDFLALAQKGWVYELRNSVKRRDASMPAVRIDSKEMAKGSICVIGEQPHAITQGVLRAFQNLIASVYGPVGTVTWGGATAASCHGPHRTYIRLYSGRPPHHAYNRDLRMLDQIYHIGLPKDRDQFVRSPAQASTFFGREGLASHLLIKQPSAMPLSPLERGFYASILIEELYQAFSFGMDVLHFDRQKAFLSKIEEYPVNLRNLDWDSPRFMQGLLTSNPRGLCAFDVFMLHALATSELENVNSNAFLEYLDHHFDELVQQTRATVQEPEFAGIIDRNCMDAP
ncbi:hypothetical protein [Actibacterium lipolyticum]|uniref:hypothetical protein n=1 Tax=Actibacterium lipolyticum TaxID=1524263 RepID=UPI0011303366|nr:hypothetical protein [Actibacterium lipolyticum]